MNNTNDDALIEEVMLLLRRADGNYDEDDETAKEIIALIRAKENDGWVDCNERMPFPYRKMYLTFMPDCSVKMSYFSGNSFHEPWGDEYPSSKQPRFWMPLPPQPPIEKEKDNE